jgi:microcystin-dependent protein
MWAGAVASPPTGWLACNGANVSRSTYSALFAVVGTTWGAGDGSTTFTLPNLLNKFPVGAGGTYALAATGGSADAIVVSHTHTATVTDPGHNHNVSAPSSGPNTGGWAAAGAATFNQSETSTTSFTSISVGISTTGSSGTNANLPPYVAVGFIIKT